MANGRWQFALPGLVVALSLGACTPHEATPAAHGAPPGNSPGTAVNSAPAISGTPAASVVAGANYDFQPFAVDADGDPLSFLISGKPAWATFAAGTGALTGTPSDAQAGTYANILITVTDGEAIRTLGPFSITVIAQPTATGTATLSWTAPAEYTDGTALAVDQLAVYRIYHGTTSGALSEVAQVEATSALTHTIDRLAAGTHYFTVTAVTTAGVESAWSEIGSKTIL